ncbi:MAG: limonene-1,2-epoxide hydrolase family protein [Pseudomonadales bacterium]
MASNEEVIRDFIKAWSTLDVDKIVEFFTDDGTYHNMPIEPVSGKDNLKEFIQGFIADWTETNWEVKLLLSQEDTVIAERLDRIKQSDRSIELPCLGVFEMQNGKIKEWRDYFDLGTYMKANS